MSGILLKKHFEKKDCIARYEVSQDWFFLLYCSRSLVSTMFFTYFYVNSYLTKAWIWKAYREDSYKHILVILQISVFKSGVRDTFHLLFKEKALHNQKIPTIIFVLRKDWNGWAGKNTIWKASQPSQWKELELRKMSENQTKWLKFGEALNVFKSDVLGKQTDEWSSQPHLLWTRALAVVS